MEKMKAALFYGKKEDIRLKEIDIPKINEDEVLIKVKACGICGSDARSYFNGAHERYKVPVILGHEVAGEISKIGKDVNSFKIGERVTVAPIYGCGECSFCVSGEENLCGQVVVFGCNFDGAYAQYMRIPAQGIRRGVLVKIPDSISNEEATLIEPFSCCLHGILRAGVKPGDTVIVIGAGPIGLSHLTLLKILGSGRVIVSDIVNPRLERAKKFGADVTINSKEDNLPLKIKELTDNEGADSVIVAAPSSKAIEDGLKTVRRGGRLVIFGGCPENSLIQIDPNLIHYSEITITGSIDSTIDDFRRTVQLVSRVNLKSFITHRFSLEEVHQAMQVMKDKKGLKVILVP